MKWFFDSSVLVPVFLDEHIHHEPSLKAYLETDRASAGCAAHTLGEIYATLTRLPGAHRIAPENALLMLQGIRERLTIVALEPQEYFSALTEAAAHGIAGGTTYDALIARCALKAKALLIYTWNVEHFRRLGPEIARRVRTP